VATGKVKYPRRTIWAFLAAVLGLERALEEREAALVHPRTQPGFASLRSEPRFQNVVSEVYR
jgi:hypothetical protein